MGDATGQGGKGGFGAPQQSGGQPQMGFGFNPNTDMPFTGQAGQTLSDGLNSAFGGLPGVMPLVNTAGQVANTAFGGLANGIQGNQPAPQTMLGGIASSYDPAADLNKGLYPAPQPAPTGGMGGGKSMLPPSFGQFQPGGRPPMFIDGNGNPTNDHGGGRVNMNINQFNPAYTPPQGPQIGFGFNPNTGGPLGGGLYGRDLSGNPNTQQLMGGMGTFTNVPAPQPVNRFAPPNAPGVRTQPRTAPRAGVSAQSARTLRPTTRNRLR